MFASREAREEREIAAAEQWKKAKANWRRVRLVLWLILAAILAALIYFAGELSGFVACRSERPEVTSTR
jgi:hypothetical protein